MQLTRLLLFSSLFVIVYSRGSPPALVPDWIREKESHEQVESKLTPPPRISFASLPPRKPAKKRQQRPIILFKSPALTKRFKDAPSLRPISRPIHQATVPIPPPTSPPTITPPISKSRMTIRSYVKMRTIEGRKVEVPWKEELLVEGKVVKTLSINGDKRPRSKRSIDRRSLNSFVNRYVSKDGSTVVTTSNDGKNQDILVVMGDAAPGTKSVFNNADRKMKKVYEEALEDVTSIFIDMGSNLARDLPKEAERFEEAKKDFTKRMDELREAGEKTRKSAVQKGIEMAATTEDQTAAAMKENLNQYLVYDTTAVMNGLLYTLPVVYELVQSAAATLDNSIDKMHGAVENYVVESLTGLREKMPPLTKTTSELEVMMKAKLKQLSDQAKKSVSGMVSYETLDAVNDMDSSEMQSVTVFQTGPGFSYLTFSSSAPSFSSSINGTEERARSALIEYKKELAPFVNGTMLDPQIFNNVPTHEQRTKNIDELLEQLGKEADDYLHNKHLEKSIELAKEVQKNPEVKKKLSEAMDNTTMYSYVPMLYNGWYTLAPVFYTQATDLAMSTSNKLNSMKGEAVSYAYSLLTDIFGQYQLALVPIQQAVSNMTETGANIESKLHETLPFAIAQATTEMPQEKKQAL